MTGVDQGPTDSSGRTTRRIELFSSPISPFVRRVRYALDRLDLPYILSPVEQLFPPPTWFLELSPLGLIPVLAMEGEKPVADSSLILDFIQDRLGPVWSQDPFLCWEEKRLSGLFNGAMLRAVQWRHECLETQRRATFESDCARTLEETLRYVERNPSLLECTTDHSTLSQPLADLVILLEYIDYRHEKFEWARQHTHILHWFEHARRDSRLLRSALPAKG